MKRIALVALALAVLCVGPTSCVFAQVPPSAGSLYQITSGSYTIIGGIWAGLRVNLPEPEQAFVLLTTDTQNSRADLSFLNEDQRTVFLTLSNGVISGNVIRFQYLTRHPYPLVEELGMLDYTVTNSPEALQINGSIEFPPICCDIPSFFGHSNVTASALPTVSIRVSEVEISWNSESNRTYQVQYRSDIGKNSWTNLGGPVAALGPAASVFDRVPAGQPQRLYRVFAVP